MKKLLSMLLVLTLVFSLTACSSTNDAGGASDAGTATTDTTESEPAQEDASTEDTAAGSGQEAEFTIGYPAVAATNTTMESMKLNRTTVAEAFGGNLITEDWDFSAEGTVQAVEKLIERGCQGVIVVPTDESILPTITSMCEEAGVYWSIGMRTINDESIKEIVYASDYYVGYVYEPGIDYGYLMGKAAGEAGAKTYAIISGAATDSDATIREVGIEQAAKEYGMECVATVRSLSTPADATGAIESILASNPDIDAIIRVTTNISGDGVAICQAIEEAGKADDIYFVSCLTEDGMESYLENGVCDYTFANITILDSVIASAILCNAIVGTPVSNDKVEVNLIYTPLTSLDDLETLVKYIDTTESALFSKEEVQELMIGKSMEEIQKNVIDSYSIQSVAERKQAQ